MTFLAATRKNLNNFQFVLLWLFACLAMQIFLNTHIINVLPQSVEWPKCGELEILIFYIVLKGEMGYN